ncbi:uncharacterized protein [Argopecten irradians]|uniref:uncharacterized protein n=1 Tax=Argopecten irradians TaxID=31199 RepID=UPI003716CD50
MKVRQNLRTATEKNLDYLFSKNMVNVSRRALIDDEVKTLVAFVHLPKIGGKGINSGGKLSLHHTLIHAVKNEELPDQVAAEHKPYNSPWIMHQRFGQKTTLLLMYRDIIISKVETPADGILALMGIHYAAMAPYSVPLNGCPSVYTVRSTRGCDTYQG